MDAHSAPPTCDPGRHVALKYPSASCADHVVPVHPAMNAFANAEALRRCCTACIPCATTCGVHARHLLGRAGKQRSYDCRVRDTTASHSSGDVQVLATGSETTALSMAGGRVTSRACCGFDARACGGRVCVNTE